MLLSNQSLKEFADLYMDNYDPNNVGSASIDLRISGWYRKMKFIDPLSVVTLRTNPKNIWHEPVRNSDGHIRIEPREVCLLSSMEYVHIPDNYACIIQERSSIGRICLEHLHAGFGDPGFHGTWTFEFINFLPVPIDIYEGERLVQMLVFMLDDHTETPYTGKYNGQQLPMPFYQQ